MPVEVTGWREMPSAGDEILQCKTEVDTVEVLLFVVYQFSWFSRVLQTKIESWFQTIKKCPLHLCNKVLKPTNSKIYDFFPKLQKQVLTNIKTHKIN